MLKRKRARVERAQARQAAYDLLTPHQKLEGAMRRHSTREIPRLSKLVNLADSKGSE